MTPEPARRRDRSSRSTRSSTRAPPTCPAVLEQVRRSTVAKAAGDHRAAPGDQRPGRRAADGLRRGTSRPGSPPAGGCSPSATAAAPPTPSSWPRLFLNPGRRRPAAARARAGQRHLGGDRAVQRHRRRRGVRPADRRVRPPRRHRGRAVDQRQLGQPAARLRRGEPARAAHHRPRRLRGRQDGRAGQHRLPVRRAVGLGAPDPGGADHHLPRAVGAHPRGARDAPASEAGR